MFPPELSKAIDYSEVYHGKLDLPKNAFPSWDQLVPWFDRSFLNGNKRARDPHKIFADVKGYDFPIVRDVQVALGRMLSRTNISCHCYAGFSPNAIASPPHKDPIEVLFVMIQGSMPWKVFEDGCDYDDKTQTMTSRSTFSRRLEQGDFIYVPTGVYHVALPDSSRVGFSFGW
jgi:hypothetical protein